MALTQISTQGIKDGTITGSDLATNVDLIDNQKLRLGTGNDTEIFHNGNHFRINESAGYVEIQGAYGVLLQKENGTENLLRALSDGAVELFHDNSKKAETTTNGFQVSNGNLDIFNTSGGANIRNVSSSGSFFIGNPNNGDLALYVQDSTDNNISLQINTGEKMLECTAGGSTDLYHHGSKKFYTTSTGAYIENRLDIGGANYSWSYPKSLNVQGSSGAILALRNWDTNTYAADTNTSIDFNLRTGNTGNQSGSCEIRAFKENGTNGNNARGLAFYTGANGGQPQKRLNITSDGNVQIANDSCKLQLGASQDLEIYHDGTDSIITNSTGDLQITDTSDDITITAADDIRLRPQGGENGINVLGDGAVELYHNNVLKLTTLSAGVQMANGSGNNTLSIYDNDKLSFGNAGDLKIYHDGTTNIIAGFTASNINIESYFNADVNIVTNSNHFAIKCISNAQVELYHDNSKKFETTSTGISVTGGITTSGASTINEDFTFVAANGEDLRFDKSDSAFEFNDNFKCVFGNSSDLKIFHDGNNSKISHVGAGGLYIGADTFGLQKGDHSENYITMAANGAVELYYDNSKKLETASFGVDVIGTLGADKVKVGDNDKLVAGSGDDLEIFYDGTDGFINQANNALKFNYNGSTKFFFGSAFLSFLDNYKIGLGNSQDLQIYHDGTYNRIAANAQIFLQNKAANETYIAAYENGQVELYHDNSIKLQTTSGGVDVTGALTVNGAAIGGGGKILQVIRTANTSLRSTSNGSFVSTGVSVTITPSSSSSKVLVRCHGTMNNASAGAGGGITIYRGSSTNLAPGDGNQTASSYFGEDDSNNIENQSFAEFLDSPNTTSSVTYTVYIRAFSGTQRWGYRGDGGILAMEVAA